MTGVTTRDDDWLADLHPGRCDRAHQLAELRRLYQVQARTQGRALRYQQVSRELAVARQSALLAAIDTLERLIMGRKP